MVSGLQDVAWSRLPEALGSARLVAREEGLLVFESAAPPGAVAELPFVNNAYSLIHRVPAGSIAEALDHLARSEDWHGGLRQACSPREGTFRLVLSDENRLVAGDRTPLGRLQSRIQQLTGLRPSPRGARVELWVLRRRSGQVFFLRRLSRRARTEKDLEKGELRPELAHLLCLLSEPEAKDVFLDPFAGSGAIPFARTFYPYEMIFAFDERDSQVLVMKERRKAGGRLRLRNGSPLIIRRADARRLERLEDGFIDKVVTDPPWGMFDPSIGDPAAFSLSAMRELCRVVKPGGVLVVALGDRELPDLLSDRLRDDLTEEARHEILLSGKKAVVVKWRRT